ncbi:MFS transporter [Chloroflexota bacterium]
MKGDAIKKRSLRVLIFGVVPLMVLAHFSHHLLTALPIPLLPMIRSDFALNYTQSGWVISAFSLANGIGQLPGGWLADRIGPRLMITIGISGVALAGLLVGLSQTYVMLIVFLALMGLLGGGYHPAAPPLISASVDPKNRGRALGFHVIGGSASFFLAPLIAAAIAAAWSWRGSFIGLAVPTMLLGIMFHILLGKRITEKKAGQSATGNHIEAPPTPGRVRRLTVFIALSAFNHAVIYSTISFIPLFLVDNFGVSRETAAALIAIIYSSGLWAGPLGGHLSDRWGRVPMILTTCFIAGPIIYLLTLIPYIWGIIIVLASIGMIQYVRMPVSQAYIIGQTSERNRSTILGIYFFSGNEGGGVLTPVLGYLIDRFGFHSSFTMAGIALVAVTLVCSVWLRGSRD